MKARYCLIVMISVLSGMLLTSSDLFAMDGVHSIRDYDSYGLTNSNADQSAIFWVKTTGGKTILLEVPPNSEKKLPLDTVDFQFMFMEKKMPPALPLMIQPSSSSMMGFAGEREQAQEEALKTFEPNYAKNIVLPDHKMVNDPHPQDTHKHFMKVRQFFAENW